MCGGPRREKKKVRLKIIEVFVLTKKEDMINFQ